MLIFEFELVRTAGRNELFTSVAKWRHVSTIQYGGSPLRIRKITRCHHDGDGRFPAIARFDVEVTPALTLFNWTLRATPDGGNIVLPPNALGKRVAGFDRAFATEVTQAAVAAFKELSPYDRTSR